MSKIKKHNIKVFSDHHDSGFITDLRSNNRQKDSDTSYSNRGDSEQLSFSFNNIFEDDNKKRKYRPIIAWKNRLKSKLSIFKKKKKSLFDRFQAWKFIKFKKTKKKKLFDFDKLLEKERSKANINYKLHTKPKKKIKFNFFTKKKFPKILKKKSKQLKIFTAESRRSKRLSFLLFIFVIFFLIFFISIFNYYFSLNNEAFKTKVLNHSLAAVSDFVEASDSIFILDFYQAHIDFMEAEGNINELKSELNKADNLILFLSYFSSDEKLKAFSQSKHISQVGLNLASLGENISLSLNSLFLFFSQEQSSQNFEDFAYYMDRSLSYLKKANNNFSNINIKAVPADFRSDFELITKKLNSLEFNMNKFVDYLPVFREVMGVDIDKRYLLVFQNNTELRASGGFIGSYAIVDIRNGKIVNMEIPSGGSYDVEAGMKALVQAPRPLSLLSPVWHFWNANWWPDWKYSARNLMWFLEKSSGPGVDGVIAINQDVLGDLLKIVGPVDMTEKYGVVVNEDNFHEVLRETIDYISKPDLFPDLEIQNSLSDEYEFKQEKPKEIISDLFNVLMERINNDLKQDDFILISQLLLKNLDNKNVLLYFENKDMQELVESYSWAGRIKESDHDYIQIVDSNIAGGKSDMLMIKNYNLKSTIQFDGSIINTLSIERDRINEEWTAFSSVRNVNWLRVYVPKGASLIKASGFAYPEEKYFKSADFELEKNPFLDENENDYEIDLSTGLRTYEEFDKTVFANWTMTDFGRKSIIEIEYDTGLNVFDQNINIASFLDRVMKRDEPIYNHSLLWQKQAGALNSNYSYELVNKSSLPVFWSYPFADNSQMLNSSSLNADKYFSIIFK